MRETGTHRLSYGSLPSPSKPRRRWLGAGLAVLAGGALLAGCGSAPKPPVTTPVSITLAAGADANPDARGRASPLTVRVYALRAPGPFEAADFFSLFEKDSATLGAELVQREEALLRPGESRKLEWTLAADVKAIAVMAAYRDLDRARWREVVALQPGTGVKLDLQFGARQIKVDRQELPPPKK